MPPVDVGVLSTDIPRPSSESDFAPSNSLFTEASTPSECDRSLLAFAARLKRWEVQPTGSEGWSKAEVTLGGIDTRDLSSKTMEARDVPGLYAIGEALDVTGWLGGYNFQWAWSSGWCAGQAIS